VLFSGTWGPKQHLLLIPQVASLLAQRDDIVFVICGDGVMRPQVEQACAGLPNVKLLPLQPAERLSDLLGLADVHLLTQSAEAEDLVLPSKLTGMLASGRPVIATCRADTEIASVVLQCGRIAEPDQPEQLAHCVAALMDDESLRIELGKQARHQAESSLSKDAILQSWLARVQLPQTMPVGMPETKVP
jgi:colanic acid biosynthesis glycosyl transferase WcaI